jgi:beta-galactosidase
VHELYSEHVPQTITDYIMRLYSRVLFSMILILCCFSCNNPHRNVTGENHFTDSTNFKILQSQFLLGSHLCREPMPPVEELKRDMEILKQKGFNLIKLQEHWAIDEPEEGQYDFSKYEELITYAKSLGMYVYIGLTCEQAPSWLYKKYPECRMVGRNGLPVVYEAQNTMPADGKPGPCFDHPGARETQKRFITKLVQTLGKYDNVLVWNTWQEVGYWSERLVGQQVCYCENTMKSFRSWLKDKYKTLDSLNKEWKTNYTRWENISPNRNYKQEFTLPQDVNWYYFMDNIKITNTLKERAAIIRQADKMNRPVFCHLGDWNYGSGKDWNYARSQDFLGSSSYPASNWGEFNDWDDAAINNPDYSDKYESLLDEMWRMVALRFDFLRSSNRPGLPIWAAEFQGGPVSTGFHKGRVPSAEDIRRWMLTVIGSGGNAISFWVTRAEIMASESNGFSLLDSEGESTERLEEASRIGKALIKHSDIFSKPALTSAKVAILVDEHNSQFCRHMLNGGDNLEYSTRGWHRLLWDEGIPVDFIEASFMDEIEINNYNAVIMPFPLAISDKVMSKLTDYVNHGGNLISEAGVARYDNNTFCVRGEISKAASALFGVRQSGFTMVREPNDGHRWSPWARTWGEFLEATSLNGVNELGGFSTMANVYLQTYKCSGSKPVLTYKDQVAGTVNSHGNGKAWLFGTFIGHNGTAYRNKNTTQFVRRLMEACNVSPEHEGELKIRKRITAGKEAWVITNPTDHRVTEKLHLNKAWAHASDLFDNGINIKNQTIEISLESLDVSIILLQ